MIRIEENMFKDRNDESIKNFKSKYGIELNEAQLG